MAYKTGTSGTPEVVVPGSLIISIPNFRADFISYPNNRPLKKPDLTANEIKDKAKKAGETEILNFLNRNIQNEEDKETKVPDSIHDIVQCSNYNQRRQINRIKAWINYLRYK